MNDDVWYSNDGGITAEDRASIDTYNLYIRCLEEKEYLLKEIARITINFGKWTSMVTSIVEDGSELNRIIANRTIFDMERLLGIQDSN
jgi:hypothetical protein